MMPWLGRAPVTHCRTGSVTLPSTQPFWAGMGATPISAPHCGLKLFQVMIVGSQGVLRKRARMPIGESPLGAKPATLARNTALCTTALLGIELRLKRRNMRWAPLKAVLKPTRRKASLEKLVVGRLDAVNVSASTGTSMVICVTAPMRVSSMTTGSS